MILAFCVGGGTTAIHGIHTGDARVRVPLEINFFSFNDFFKRALYSEALNFEISIDRWTIEMLSDILRIPRLVLARKT